MHIYIYILIKSYYENYEELITSIENCLSHNINEVKQVQRESKKIK